MDNPMKVRQKVGGMTRPKWDPRKFSFSKKFGATTPSELSTADFDVWVPLATKDQGANDLCTDYGATGAAEAQFGTVLDEAFQRAAHNAIAGTPGFVGAADPHQAALAIIKIGALPKNAAPFTVDGDPTQWADLSKYPSQLVTQAGNDKEFSVYIVDGQADLFDSIRDAMLISIQKNFKTPIQVGAIWRQSWLAAVNGIISTNDPNEPYSDHEFVIVGQKTINGTLYLKAHLSSGQVGDCATPPGGFFYFPRSIVNAFLFAQAFAPGDPNDYKAQLWNILQKLYNALYNAFFPAPKNSGFPPPPAPVAPPQPQQKPTVNLPPAENTVPGPAPVPARVVVFKSKIIVWARAIQDQEGGRPQNRNMKDNNPGNIKATKYGKSLGATTGVDLQNVATDGLGFCIYKDYPTGFRALCQLLTDAASNELIGFHNVTLGQFTQIYAQPPNGNYAAAVAQALGVGVDTPIAKLLS